MENFLDLATVGILAFQGSFLQGQVWQVHPWTVVPFFKMGRQRLRHERISGWNLHESFINSWSQTQQLHPHQTTLPPQPAYRHLFCPVSHVQLQFGSESSSRPPAAVRETTSGSLILVPPSDVAQLGQIPPGLLRFKKTVNPKLLLDWCLQGSTGLLISPPGFMSFNWVTVYW